MNNNTNIHSVSIPCPRWLQRQMIRNLQKTARCHYLGDRAARAAAILQEIPKRANKASAQEKLRSSDRQPMSTTLSVKKNGLVKRAYQGLKNRCVKFLNRIKGNNG